MSGWKVECVEAMSLGRRNRLTDMYVLSPFVWIVDGGYEMLIRAVPRRDDEPRLKMAEVWRGTSSDGLHFEMDGAPVLWPGPSLMDLDGCEDPTVVIADGQARVWYTGWNQRQETGRLLLARGPDCERIAKAGMVLDNVAPFRNPKEAEVVKLPDGRFRLYFEYSDEGASAIGQVEADDLDGPWSKPKRAAIHPRPKAWDGWHLSPGPVLDAAGPSPTMIYNGATPEARWRIGWARFDKGLTKLVDRCEDPLIEPENVSGAGTDIAFAASALQPGKDKAYLYFSQSDQDLRRATLVRA